MEREVKLLEVSKNYKQFTLRHKSKHICIKNTLKPHYQTQESTVSKSNM